MKIIFKEPGKYPEIKEVADELKSYQDLVGGNIGCVPFASHVYPDIILICNEEGKLVIDLKPNVLLTDQDGKPVDYISGNLILVETTPDGDFKEIEGAEKQQLLINMLDVRSFIDDERKTDAVDNCYASFFMDKFTKKN